jgi:choline dehydrogenase
VPTRPAACCCWKPAAEDRNLWLRLPVGYFRTIFDPRFSWQFEVEPQPRPAIARIVWPRGRMLGGSSAINGLLYIRGQHAGLRRLGRGGRHRLGLPRGAAVLQALGTL